MTKLFCLTLKVIKSVFNCSKVCFTNMAHSDFYTDYRICDLTDYLTNIKILAVESAFRLPVLLLPYTNE